MRGIKQIRIAFLLLFIMVLAGVIFKYMQISNKTNMEKLESKRFVLDENSIKIKKFNVQVGKVKVYLTKEKRIVELDLEEYIAGVVCKEMPANFELEALKAQAVAARTYAVSRMKSAGGGGCGENPEADLCDSTHCQAYVSKETRMKDWPEADRDKLWEKVSTAVNDTKGEVITYDNKLVESPLYFAASSGSTMNSEDVFVMSRPYLKSVDSPGEEVAPNYKSIVSFSFDQLQETINKNYPEAKIDKSTLKDQVKILKTDEGRNVTSISVGEIQLTGAKFRKLLGLRSASFQIEYKNDSMVVTCYGYGHGVGMSQWGANIMARDKRNYKEILTHYYSGVSIDKVTVK